MKQDNKNYQLLNDYMSKGFTMKGITFNIYDDNQRKATIALFNMLQEIKKHDVTFVMDWMQSNINKHMYEYVLRLLALYGNQNVEKLLPPFIYKPHYFVNSETIAKAYRVKLNKGHINKQEADVYQIYKNNDHITYINTNYSSWNMPLDICDIEVNYFREDIALNSYYYGVHLAHPFWMSNEELDQINSRHAEHYHYKHQQLLARYLLEKEHLDTRNTSLNHQCVGDYYPFLSYENGLAFPSRSHFRNISNEYKVALISIDIALKEFISRRLIIMDNGTLIKITDDNYISLLSKLIRANLDGIKTAKMIRNVYGYGTYNYPMNQYNPAPSVLHHPETSLRDPVYWNIIESALKYFRDFTNTIEPFDISTYEMNELSITHNDFSVIATYFDYYQFNINKALYPLDSPSELSTVIAARQMRLNYMPFTLNFTVLSAIQQSVAVRLFLGPRCYYTTCFHNYYKFFELDSYIVKMEEGANILSWCPQTSSKFSFDDYYNLETIKEKENKFDIFKFPGNLVIPKGSEEGLNMTLFIIITQVNDSISNSFLYNKYNNQTSLEIDDKPLGFPFHRIAKNYVHNANNYRFYNISIYHKKRTINASGHFSPHLY
ncbi:basic juvenile hormone-suppressible protein 2-like isoform X2 [Galleria mellonella]|uniref:Basic juvenile hormone-suppressible protein 2-like isoform X2 n=1 Tax=Galleria mellonella TaxID=7137 RepID=A0A6J3BTE8_GALME|nr:basic juvenile hormone-suppressible protein 2-like isoform X2 [Galleria mellonella]